MIKVSGSAKLCVNYDVELNMTEEQFDALSYRKKEGLINANIDWHDALRNADVTDIDVDDLEEIE